ncbi:hypothetical protein BJ085DRAFT_21438, partial [Dimargaris cristalligena]
IITGGADFLVRSFETAPEARDRETQTMEAQSDSITCLAVTDHAVIVGSEDRTVVVYDYPSFEYQSMIARTTAPVRDLEVSSDREWVGIACDEEETLLMVRINNISQTLRLKGHTRSIHSLTFHPAEPRLASVDGEGTVRIWDYSDLSHPTCIKTLPCVTPGNKSESSTCKLQWHPRGQWLAIPTHNNDVTIYDTSTWKSAACLAKQHQAPVSRCDWSSNGAYLVSIDPEGGFVIWDTLKQTPIFHDKHQAGLSHVAWNPKGNILAMTDVQGMLTIWDDVIPNANDLVLPHIPIASGSAVKPNSNLLASTAKPDIASVKDKVASLAIIASDSDSDIEDFIVHDNGIADGIEDRRTRSSGKSESFDHPYFQPGSTPFALNRCILAYNMIGIVSAIDHDTHNTINVDFHDKALHRSFHFTDHYKFSMASLSERGVLFGTEATADEPSLISYRPYESWAANSDWLYRLPMGEELLALSMTSTHSAIVTSQGFLRVFTSSGLQLAIYTISPDIVCLAGGGPNFLVVYQGGSGTSLYYRLFDAEKKVLSQQGAIPLPEEVGLQWAGFSDDTDIPALYDTRGNLLVLDKFRLPGQGQWVPIWDGSVTIPSADEEQLTHDPNARVQSDQWLWVVGFSSTQSQRRRGLRYTLRRPPPVPVVPRPLLTQLDLRMPLLNHDAAVSQLEERLLRASLFAINQRTDPLAPEPNSQAALSATDPAVLREFLQEDKLTLQLIQAACKADRIYRALDLTSLLHLPKSIDAAVKIAMFHRYPTLAERINLVKQTKFIDDEESLNPPVTQSYRNPPPASTTMIYPRSPRPAREPPVTQSAVEYTPGPSLNSALNRPAPGQSRRAPVDDSDVRSPMSSRMGGMAAQSELASESPRKPTSIVSRNPFAVKKPVVAAALEPEVIPRGNSFFNAVDHLMQSKGMLLVPLLLVGS